MKPEINLVPKVSIRRDPRFSLEYNWEHVVIPNIKECQERGVLVTPLTVFDDGVIIGWFLHGYVPAPGKILHQCPPPDEYISNYSI